MKLKLLTILLLTFCSGNLLAQFGYYTKEGKALNAKIDHLRKEGKTLEAEKLLFESNEKFPNEKLDWIANEKLNTGDIKGANKCWDALIASAEREWSTTKDKEVKATLEIFLDQPFYNHQAVGNLTIGDPAVGIRAAIGHLRFGTRKSFSHYQKVSCKLAIGVCYQTNDLESLKTIKSLSEKAGHERGIFESKIYSLLIEKKYDEVIALNAAGTKGEDYRLAKDVLKSVLPFAYYGKGDTENLKKSIDGLGKITVFESLSYYLGLLALSQKEYAQAISMFTEAMEPTKFFIFGQNKRTGTFRYYTYRAEAYLGLKDYVNAKKEFEAALVYNPNYQPALDGLAKLEGSHVVALRADKTGPEIKILEPANTRGLKIVAAGKDVMIKGMASDPSGLKSTTINGHSVYSKEAGDFWGTVTLADGINKFEIIATDLAGNTTKEIFEIEKAATAVAAVPIAVTEKIGKNYAVFIASQNYDDSTIPSLENPIADAIKLKLILKNSYNFADDNIYSLFNPQRDDFKKKFLELKEALQPEDNLVIFYAGHGIWVDKEKKGYWLLTDAQRNDVNTWLPNKQVLDMIAELPSRHTLLITDACFSGSVFKSRSIGTDAPAAVKEMDNKITRVAITSGNDTEVPDVSIFMKHLVKALSENKDKYLSAQKMFITRIIEAVMTESKTEPRYGTLELAGHVGGDFIFSKK
ncbi:MAG TPA: caspase family protein [Pedobacter sp.]|uniref:caspase family protein n=1 Tax=Pedobacter sp. TaxID=1411316 RepID=UPI002BCAA917|nr:caspase family protein [Pedobacter sp.]HMI01223.1 caspase family protein [Pedobacter sp.]